MVPPDVAARHPIAVMIDDLRAARPQSGLASASVVWQAPAEGGIPRYMAIFQDNMPEEVGPVRSARYYYIAWAAEWRAVYVHSGGSPQALATLRAKGNGQLRLQRRRVPLQRDASTGSQTRFSPHNLYTDGHEAAQPRPSGSGPRTRPTRPVWTVRARCAARVAAVRRHDHGRLPVQHDQLQLRPQDEHVPALGHRREEADRRRRRDPDRARRTSSSCGCRSGRSTTATPGPRGSRPTVVGSGTAWISTNGRTIKGTWKKTAMTKPTKFYDGQGKEVTFTVGQTFVQVVAGGYPVAFQAGSNQPPATPAPSAPATPSASPS